MRIRKGVHTFSVDWEYGDLAVHVVDTGTHTILFGAGAGDESTGQVIELVNDHDVDVVIVEHGDFDHYAGVPPLLEAVDDLQVAVPRGDASVLEENSIEPDHTLEAGKMYFNVTTIAAPGHTPGNMAYLYDDVLVAGDTVVGVDSTFAAEGDYPGAFTAAAPRWNDNDEKARESVENLREFEFEIVLVSHGSNAYENGRDELDALADALDS